MHFYTKGVLNQLTGPLVSDEHIFDFGKGQNNDNDRIMMWRAGVNSKRFDFGIWNGNSACSVQSGEVWYLMQINIHIDKNMLS